LKKKWATPVRIKLARACERARKQGMRIGLRNAHTIVNKARRYQDGRSKSPSVKDPSVQGEHEFSANTLHAICLEIQQEIQKAGESK